MYTDLAKTCPYNHKYTEAIANQFAQPTAFYQSEVGTHLCICSSMDKFFCGQIIQKNVDNLNKLKLFQSVPLLKFNCVGVFFFILF